MMGDQTLSNLEKEYEQYQQQPSNKNNLAPGNTVGLGNKFKMMRKKEIADKEDGVQSLKSKWTQI